MTNVYEGKPDGRQEPDSGRAEWQAPPSRFRPRYRNLSEEEKALHDEIKAKAVELEQLYAKVKTGRYASLAMTSLEESVMWIIKELTA